MSKKYYVSKWDEWMKLFNKVEINPHGTAKFRNIFEWDEEYKNNAMTEATETNDS